MNADRIVREFIEMFPGRCLICALHRFGKTELGIEKPLEVHDCIERCCSSSHWPPDAACKDFLAGMNGRCVYCDHESKCHPGPGATCEIGSTKGGA